MNNPSFSWEKLGSNYYRNREVNKLQWPAVFNNADILYTVSTSFIAMISKDSYSIEIYNYYGKLLETVSLKLLGRESLIDIKFEDELGLKLMLVFDESVKLITNWNPLEVKSIELPNEVQDTIWDYDHGIILLKETQSIWKCNWSRLTIEEVYNNKKTNDKTINALTSTYQLMTKIHWVYYEDRVILLDVDNVYEVDLSTKNQITKIKGLHEWQRIAVSKQGEISLFNFKHNSLRIYKDLKKPAIMESNLDDASLKDIMWFDDNLIACILEDEVRIYDQQGFYVTFWYPDDILFANAEINCLKIVTENSVNIITKVDTPTENIFRIGSTEPGAMLFDSWKLLEEYPPKAIERLKNIDLKSAVMDCIDAAKDEYSSSLQKQLLNSATFGKSSLPYKSFDSNIFVKTCDSIRILNVLRNIGIFLTERQFKYYTFDQVVDILFLLHKYAETIELIRMTDRNDLYPKLFKHWCSSKIKCSADLEDEELLRIIQSQLKELPVGVKAPMSEISTIASLEGRFTLCRNLALLETNPILKIRSLYELDDDSLAIRESIKTENPEIIISLLLQLRNKLTKAQLAKLLILDSFNDQLYSYFNRNDSEFLFDFYMQTDQFVDLARCILEQGKSQNAVNSILPQILDLYEKHSNNHLLKQDSDLIKRQLTLIEYKSSLTHIFGTDFNSFTLDETLEKLIEMQQEKYVRELIKKFKINDRKYYQINCRTLVRLKRFNELYQFATSKKSPIGYAAFYNRLKKAGHKKEAIPYIDMITQITAEERHNMLLECQGQE